MKCFWRGLFVALVYLAYAGTARCEEFAQAGQAAFAGNSVWQTEQPRRLDVAAEPIPGEFQLVSGETDISADGPVQSPANAPIQVGKIDLNECEDCCSPVWAHRSGILGEVMILRARNAEVAYAAAIDGAIVPPPNPPIQVGPIAVVDPDFSAGFRVGGVYAMDDCSSISATYSRFQSSGTGAVATAAPLVLRSLVLHPGTANAGSDFLSATAWNNIRFDLVDVDYRAVWASDDLWVVNYLIGARYAGLKQQFGASYTGTGTTDTLATNTNFDGAGVRVGIDGQRFACNSGFMVYGRSSASFVAGEFRSSYLQGSDVDPVIVNTSWRAGRIVSILDLELGAGWQSRCGRVRISGGYMVMGWFNAIPSNQWINAVQNNNFTGLGSNVSAITFDGLTTRLEYRW